MRSGCAGDDKIVKTTTRLLDRLLLLQNERVQRCCCPLSLFSTIAEALRRWNRFRTFSLNSNKMTSKTWIALLLLAASSSAVATVEQCRCETQSEHFYSMEAPELSSSSKDAKGYYIVDGIRVLPPDECRQHEEQTPHKETVASKETLFNVANTLFGKRKLGSVFDGLFTQHTDMSEGGLRGSVSQSLAVTTDIFDCDSSSLAGVKSTPLSSLTTTSTSASTGFGSIDESRKGKLDAIVMQNSDAQVDCSKLPLAVRLHQKELPLHCLCPPNVDPASLPPVCSSIAQ